jgi:hypothetical protein
MGEREPARPSGVIPGVARRAKGAEMSPNSRFPINVVMAAALCLSAGLWGSAADPPTPTPTRTPRPAGGTSLNEMAKDTELKGAEKGKEIVITNENLSEYADKGSVTAVSGADTSNLRPVRDPAKVDQVTSNDPENSDERRRYWQNEYKRQVELVASIRYQITVLDGEIPGLWRDFYAWDDPMYRDGVIKPKLDQAMARRQGLEEQLVDAEGKLSEIKEQARRDGAEPGWFRGISVPTPYPPTPTPEIVIY